MGIPVCIPKTPKNALKYVTAAIEKNWVSSLCFDDEVNFIDKLEKELSAYVGASHGVVVTSGTTALHLALRAANVGPGDEVILPASTMVATCSTVVQLGARPVIVDIDPDTWCIDVNQVAAAVTANTRVIIPVHLYGYPCDMDPIMELAAQHNLIVLEDAAEAIGTVYKGRPAGSLGHMATFSFYANKTVTSGEGGIVTTRDDVLATKLRSLKNHAFAEPRFIHEEFGYNYRMNNLTAAYAYASFEEVEEAVAARIDHAHKYDRALQDFPGVTIPPAARGDDVNSYWMYGILIYGKAFGRSKADVRQELKKQYGIETRDFFYPMHKQPAFVKLDGANEGLSLPVSERLWDQGLYLPSSTGLSDQEIGQVVEALRALAS